MKHVVILGAGMVSRPIVQYLLDQTDIRVTVASRTKSKADRVINNHPNGKAIAFDINNEAHLARLVQEADVIVSLLPYTYHVKVAVLCLKYKKHLVTTSYVSDEMKSLDIKAKQVGVLLLNECGLDPGIDHMSAMRIIHHIQEKHGHVISFKSTTGALPAHESNTNPFGYKFSWSPLGVLLASRNPAKWLENNKVISIPGESLFENYILQDVPDIGTFENYPNRDSLAYQDIYGLKEAHTVYRGTFRMTGWCETLRAIAELGWLHNTPIPQFTATTYADVTRHLIGLTAKEDLNNKTAKFLELKPYSSVIKRMHWLGLFSEEPLPKDKTTPIEYLNTLTMKKMALNASERDMIVMHHEFIAKYQGGKEYITATLVDYGIPYGDSAVARTVALPAAIAVKMILNKTITHTGVHIPIHPDIYNPILDELDTMNIKFKERYTNIK
jgi:saccharopine dehydrogenase-like NADP-dependent oxidoreductase